MQFVTALMLFFQQYLIPHSREQTGLSTDNVLIHEEALDALIKNYCRESGVRNLQKLIEKVNFIVISGYLLVLNA